MHTPLRLAPYTLKKLNLWSNNPSAEVVTLDEIDDIYVAPSPYPSWSASLSDETITSSDEDTSDGDSMFSLVPDDSTFDYSTSLGKLFESCAIFAFSFSSKIVTPVQ